jgi:diguanylate cyclase (GGDEF)-like protein
MNPIYTKTTEELRAKVLKGLCLLFLIASAITFIVNLVRGGNIIFILLELGLTVLYSSLLIFVHKYGIRPWCKAITVYSYILVISYITFVGDLSGGLLNWVFTIPIMLYFLYRKKHAFIASFIIMLFQTANVYYEASYGSAESIRGIPNFVLAYGLIWLLANIYETNNNTMKLEIIDQAIKDPLTGALNRRALLQSFKSLNTSISSVSLCMIDIDFFKKVNDKYGHDIGDLILIRFVKILTEQTCFSQVYRLGGEEFAILFHDELSVAITKINAILRVVNTISYDDIQPSLTLCFSAGIVQIEQSSDISNILKQADEYLYQAKNSGRNRVVSSASALD